MITNITDRERTQAALILALESARDEMSARIPQWLPIETAPRNSKARLVWCQERRNTYAVNWYGNDWYIFGACHLMLQETATHWMPLPPPPSDKPIWDQLAEIGASDPQAWDKP